MTAFSVPTRDEVTPENQALFDNLKKALGFVPNLFATFAHSPTALGTYLTLQNAKSSLRPREREVINLAVSQVNTCDYCLAAHTALAKMLGLTEVQIAEIRRGGASFDARFARAVAEHRGHVLAETTDAFLAAGWTQADLVDAIIIIGDKTISNYLHGVTKVPVDFPAAEKLAA